MKNIANICSTSYPLHFVAIIVITIATLHSATAQNLSLEPFRKGEMTSIPEHPQVTREVLRSLGASGINNKKAAKPLIDGIYSYTPLGYRQEGGFNASYGLAKASAFSGLHNLAGMSPCITDPTQCGQYSQFSQSTVASALGDYGSSAVNASLDLLNGLLPGGQNWNQFYGQYPSPGGQSFDSYGSGSQTYADAIYSQAYSPQIQALLGYDPNSSYNFTTQFINYTSSLFSPTADWNSSFSLFPSSTGSFAEGRVVQNGTLAERYAAVAHQQLANQYIDPALYELRKEVYNIQAELLLRDPYYVYNSYLLNNYQLQIYSLSPNYNTLVSLSEEVASWISPPQDSATLINRYFKRYLLNYYQTLVQYDALVYLYTHPADLQLLTNHANFANQAASAIFNNTNFIAWYNDWILRYQTAEVASAATVEAMMNDLVEDYPAFLTYMELLQEIRQVTTGVEGLPSVQNATTLVINTQNDQQFNIEVAQLYEGYKNRVNELLGQTRFVVELERYYERLNGLIELDPYYQELKQRYQVNTQEVQAYQYEMALAVNNCLALYGNACNAYNDPTVINLMQSGRSNYLANNLAAFNEDYNLFWYHFYTGEGYRNLEFESQLSIEQAIAQVVPQITAARQEYQNAIEALPQMIAIRAAMLAVYNDLLGITLSDGVTTVGAALEQMAVLAANLEESPGFPGSLPEIIIRGNYPNPFSSTTNVEFELPEPANVKIEIFDLFGRRVATLPTRKLGRGSQAIEVDGSTLVSGLYVYKVQAQTATSTKVKSGRLQVQK